MLELDLQTMLSWAAPRHIEELNTQVNERQNYQYRKKLMWRFCAPPPNLQSWMDAQSLSTDLFAVLSAHEVLAMELKIKKPGAQELRKIEPGQISFLSTLNKPGLTGLMVYNLFDQVDDSDSPPDATKARTILSRIAAVKIPDFLARNGESLEKNFDPEARTFEKYLDALQTEIPASGRGNYRRWGAHLASLLARGDRPTNLLLWFISDNTISAMLAPTEEEFSLLLQFVSLPKAAAIYRSWVTYQRSIHSAIPPTRPAPGKSLSTSSKIQEDLIAMNYPLKAEVLRLDVRPDFKGRLADAISEFQTQLQKVGEERSSVNHSEPNEEFR